MHHAGLFGESRFSHCLIVFPCATRGKGIIGGRPGLYEDVGSALGNIKKRAILVYNEMTSINHYSQGGKGFSMDNLLNKGRGVSRKVS